MEKPSKKNLWALIPLFFVLLLALLNLQEVLNKTYALIIKEPNLTHSGYVNANGLHQATTYPIETMYPITSATYRPTSTPWPSKTPTPTPPFVYRNTNTLPGSTADPSTTDTTPDQTRNPGQTLTAFFTTRTAQSFTATHTVFATNTDVPKQSETPEPQETPQEDGEDLGRGEEDPTSTPINLEVKTDKTNRYQDKNRTFNWLFYAVIVLFAGLAVFLYTRKNSLNPSNKHKNNE